MLHGLNKTVVCFGVRLTVEPKNYLLSVSEHFHRHTLEKCVSLGQQEAWG